MYRVKFWDVDTEEPIDRRVFSTPYEPRENLVYRFRENDNTTRALRFQVARVEIDQTWDGTADGVAWVYVKKLSNA